MMLTTFKISSTPILKGQNKHKILYILFLLVSSSITLYAQTLKDEWVICNNQGCKLLDPYYSAGVTVKWSGSCVDGKADGYGKLIKYIDGEYESTFEGEFENGIRQGKGTFSHISGSILKSNFENGQAIGYGQYKFDDGAHYEGGIINYRQHGKGILKMANGSIFDGFFVSDIMYTGKYTAYDGAVTYIQEYYPVDKIKEIKTAYKPKIGVRVTEYFDENWIRCSQKDASFYRLVTYGSDNKPIGIVRDYFINGQLQSDFTAVYLDYDDEGKNFHENEATWYYKNGKIEQKRYYYNNKMNGKNTFYYDNGQLATEANYKYGNLDGEYFQWYKTGKPRLVAYYENGLLLENKYVEYDENGLGALVYNENFKANSATWISEKATHSSYINETNQLEFKLNENKATIRTNYITLEQSSDYSIESVIQKKTGQGSEGYGIIFGFKDWNNYYQFLISEVGSFAIFGQFEGISVTIVDWTKSSLINIGHKLNLLKIMKFDDDFIFSINGEVLDRTKSKDLRGNNLGIIAHGKGEYLLGKIVVKEFMSIEELKSKAPKPISSNSSEWKGSGSGFFISENGYIATNYHVVKDASVIEVVYFQKGIKKTYNAKVIVTDKQNDLAIIQIQDSKFSLLPSIPYVFTSNLKDVGSDVFALGYPMVDIMGDEIKFTDGKISSKTGIQGDITVYQISVPIQPGNSGGPLFDNEGNLVGITSSALNKEYFNSENVNYAIKTAYLKNLIDVMPERIGLPNYIEIYNKPLTEKIKLLSDFIPIIRVK